MKTLLIAFSFFISVNVFSQNITNTLGTGGVFTIKDATNNYLTLSQSTGQVNILRSLRLENTTSSSLGILFKGADRFLHNYGTNNTFLGINSGNFTMTGQHNTAVGLQSLFSNTSGTRNTALGNYCLYSNTIGNYNTAVGTESLISNTIGNYNTAVGYWSLRINEEGIGNTAVGYKSLDVNTGSYNTAVGVNSLMFSTRSWNTALGYSAGSSITTGHSNTALGYSAGSSITTGSHNITIGIDAQVPSATGYGQVRIGSGDIIYASINTPWSVSSDRRWKSNILNSNLGLNFISKLRPVSYTRNNDEKQKSEYGFIAQEVEEVLKESGVDNSGMITIDDEGRYEMRYNDLLAPMVKAIQELKTKCEELKTENDILKQNSQNLSAEVEAFKSINEKLVKLEQKVNELTSVKYTSLSKTDKIKTISKKGDEK